MTVLRSALDRENVTDSTGKSMCFTCVLGFFGSAGFSSFSLLFSADGFLADSFGVLFVSAGFSLAPPSVVSYLKHTIY